MDNKPTKAKNWKKTLYTAILGAFLAFIIGKLFDPLFEYLFSIFLSIGGSFINAIADSTFQKISDGFSDQTSLLLLYIIYLACFTYLVSEFISLKRLFHNSANMPQSPEEKKPSTPEVYNFKDLSVEELKQIISETSHTMEDLSQRLEHSEKATNRRKRIDTIQYIAARCIFIFLIFMLFFLYSRNVFITQKITVITNNIEIVSPYISDFEYKQLKSCFHSIQNGEDYEALNLTLKSIAESNSITLKK